MLRVFTWLSGVHQRCRGCGRVARVVDSTRGLVVLHAVIVLGYLAGFVVCFELDVVRRLLEGRTVEIGTPLWYVLAACLPFAPAALLGGIALGAVADRRGPSPAGADSMSSRRFAWTYVLIASLSAVLAGVAVSIYLTARLGG